MFNVLHQCYSTFLNQRAKFLENTSERATNQVVKEAKMVRSSIKAKFKVANMASKQGNWGKT